MENLSQHFASYCAAQYNPHITPQTTMEELDLDYGTNGPPGWTHTFAHTHTRNSDSNNA